MWCWAASGKMCMGFLGKSVEQCDEANKEFGRTDCCGHPVPGDCINGGWPEFAKYQFSAVHTSDQALSWEQLREQIGCKGKPVAFTWHWIGGGGHMMVAKGYYTSKGNNYVRRDNPLPRGIGTEDVIPYDEYVAGDDHTHWDDYYEITKQP